MPALAVVPRLGERRTIKAMLPGRDVALDTCDPRGAWETCDECLRSIAAFLAAEMDWSLEAAVNKTFTSYHAELGGSCSLERAQELGLMTAAACYRRRRDVGSRAADMFVAGLDAQLQAVVVEMPRRDAGMRRAFAWWAAACFLVLALLGLLAVVW